MRINVFLKIMHFGANLLVIKFKLYFLKKAEKYSLIFATQIRKQDLVAQLDRASAF